MNPVDQIPQEELGPEHDAAVESMVEAAGAADYLDRVYVMLDTIADTHDLPSHIVQDARAIQKDVETLGEQCEQHAEAMSDRTEEIKERIKDELDGF